MFKKLILTLGSLLIMTATAEAASPANTLILELSTGGDVVIELLPERAPAHVERIKKLTREGFYDGITFHRVIPEFMAQTGDPTGTGMGGSEYPDLDDEFTDYEYVRGTIGAATSGPNTANSQFFISFNDEGCKHLKGRHSVWGQVIEGMEYVDKLAENRSGTPDKIIKATIASDLEKEEAPSAEDAAE